MNQNDLRRLAAIGGMDLTQPSVSFKDFNMFKNKGFDLLQDYQNNNLMQPPVDEEADKKAKRKEGLQNLRDTLAIIGARRSGNYALAEQMKQQVNLRKQQEEQQKKLKTEQDLLRQQQQEFMKTLDPNSDLAQKIRVNQLFGFTPSFNNTKLTKSDFVVEILEKIKNNPGYKLTKTDQRILDTISDTDPMKILIRNRLNEMQVNNFDNESTNQSGPITVTSKEEFDNLPKGTKYIYNGTEYIKGQ